MLLLLLLLSHSHYTAIICQARNSHDERFFSARNSLRRIKSRAKNSSRIEFQFTHAAVQYTAHPCTRKDFLVILHTNYIKGTVHQDGSGWCMVSFNWSSLIGDGRRFFKAKSARSLSYESLSSFLAPPCLTIGNYERNCRLQTKKILTPVRCLWRDFILHSYII